MTVYVTDIQRVGVWRLVAGQSVRVEEMRAKVYGSRDDDHERELHRIVIAAGIWTSGPSRNNAMYVNGPDTHWDIPGGLRYVAIAKGAEPKSQDWVDENIVLPRRRDYVRTCARAIADASRDPVNPAAAMFAVIDAMTAVDFRSFLLLQETLGLEIPLSKDVDTRNDWVATFATSTV